MATSAKSVASDKTFFVGREGNRSRSIVTLTESAGVGSVTLAVEPSLSGNLLDPDGSHTVTIAGITPTNLLASSDGTQLHFDIPANSTKGVYKCSFEVGTNDGQWLAMTGRMDVV